MRPSLERSAASTPQLMVDGTGSSRSRLELAMDGSVRFVNDNEVPFLPSNNHSTTRPAPPPAQVATAGGMDTANSLHQDSVVRGRHGSSEIPVPMTTPMLERRRPPVIETTSARRSTDLSPSGDGVGGRGGGSGVGGGFESSGSSPRSVKHSNDSATIPPPNSPTSPPAVSPTSPPPTSHLPTLPTSPTPRSPKERLLRPPPSPRSPRQAQPSPQNARPSSQNARPSPQQAQPPSQQQVQPPSQKQVQPPPRLEQPPPGQAQTPPRPSQPPQQQQQVSKITTTRPPPPPQEQHHPRSPSPRKQRSPTPKPSRSLSPSPLAQASSSLSSSLPPASPRTPSRSRRMPPLPTRGLSSSNLLRSRKSQQEATVSSFPLESADNNDENNDNTNTTANAVYSPPRRRSRSLGVPRRRSLSRGASFRRRGVAEFVLGDESEHVPLIRDRNSNRGETPPRERGGENLHRYRNVPPTVASPLDNKNNSSTTATPSSTAATDGSGAGAGAAGGPGVGGTHPNPADEVTNRTEMYPPVPGVMDTNMGGTPVDLTNMVQTHAATTPMTAGIEMDENEVTLHLSCQHLPLKNIVGGSGKRKAVYCRVFLHRPIPNAQQRDEEPHSFRQTLLRGGTSPRGGSRRGMHRTSSSLSSLSHEDDARDDVGHESELRKSHYFDEPPMGSREIGHTEVVYDTPHPKFATPLLVTGLALGKAHDVIVCVYVETKLIGTCTLSLERDLLCNDRLRFSSVLQCGGSVTVAVKPTVTNYHHLAFQMSVVGLQKEQGRITKLLRGRKNLNTYLVMSYRKRRPASQQQQQQQQQQQEKQLQPNLSRARSVSFSDPQAQQRSYARSSSHGSSNGSSMDDEDDEDEDNADDDGAHGAKARSGKVKDWAWEIIWRSELILDNGAPRFRCGHIQPMRLNGGDLDTPVRFSLMDWNDKVRGHKKVGTAKTKLACLRGESVIALQRRGTLVGFLNNERSSPTIAPSVMEYMYSRHHAMNIVFATDYAGANSFYGGDSSDGSSSVLPPPENGADYSPSLSSTASSTAAGRQKSYRNVSSNNDNNNNNNNHSMSMNSLESTPGRSQRRRGPRLHEYLKAMNVISRFLHAYTNIRHVRLMAGSEDMTQHQLTVGSSGLPGVEAIIRENSSNDDGEYDPSHVLRLVDKGTADASQYAAKHSDRAASAYSILFVFVEARQTSHDLVALLERLCLASHEPLSIIFVGVGAPSYMSRPHDGEDSLDVLNNVATQLTSPTLLEFARHVAHYVPYYPYEDDPDVFIRKLFTRLSCQMLQYRLAMQILG